MSRLDLVVGEGGLERIVGGGKGEVGDKDERLGRLTLRGALGLTLGTGCRWLGFAGFGLGFSGTGGGGGGGGIAVGSGGSSSGLLLLSSLCGLGRLGTVGLLCVVTVGGGVGSILLGGALLTFVGTSAAWRAGGFLGLLGTGSSALWLVGVSSGLGLGRLYADLATADLALVEELDGGLCFRIGGESDESVTERTSAAGDDLGMCAVKRVEKRQMDK